VADNAEWGESVLISKQREKRMKTAELINPNDFQYGSKLRTAAIQAKRNNAYDPNKLFAKKQPPKEIIAIPYPGFIIKARSVIEEERKIFVNVLHHPIIVDEELWLLAAERPARQDAHNKSFFGQVAIRASVLERYRQEDAEKPVPVEPLIYIDPTPNCTTDRYGYEYPLYNVVVSSIYFNAEQIATRDVKISDPTSVNKIIQVVNHTYHETMNSTEFQLPRSKIRYRGLPLMGPVKYLKSTVDVEFVSAEEIVYNVPSSATTVGGSSTFYSRQYSALNQPPPYVASSGTGIGNTTATTSGGVMGSGRRPSKSRSVGMGVGMGFFPFAGMPVSGGGVPVGAVAGHQDRDQDNMSEITLSTNATNEPITAAGWTPSSSNPYDNQKASTSSYNQLQTGQGNHRSGVEGIKRAEEGGAGTGGGVGVGFGVGHSSNEGEDGNAEDDVSGAGEGATSKTWFANQRMTHMPGSKERIESIERLDAERRRAQIRLQLHQSQALATGTATATAAAGSGSGAGAINAEGAGATSSNISSAVAVAVGGSGSGAHGPENNDSNDPNLPAASPGRKEYAKVPHLSIVDEQFVRNRRRYPLFSSHHVQGQLMKNYKNFKLIPGAKTMNYMGLNEDKALKDASCVDPQQLLGYAILLPYEPEFHEPLIASTMNGGSNRRPLLDSSYMYVVIDTAKNNKNKSEFKIYNSLIGNAWVRLYRNEHKIGIHFRILRRIIVVT